MRARQIMHRHNPNAVCGSEGHQLAFIEDVCDPDGRWFRIEYVCDSDGTNARAWCRFNPWNGNPFSYHQSHLSSQGFICLGTGSHNGGRSTFDLDYAIRRARFWCTGYSYLREHGYQSTCRDIAEWGG